MYDRGVRLSALLVLLVSVPACGPDARHARAEETVRLAARALTDVQATAGGESTAELDRAVEDASSWLVQSEHGVELWPSAGSLAFETTTPCLARSLGEVRDALAAIGRDVPDTLEQAEALAHDWSERRCARRRGESDAAPAASIEDTAPPSEGPAPGE